MSRLGEGCVLCHQRNGAHSVNLVHDNSALQGLNVSLKVAIIARGDKVYLFPRTQAERNRSKWMSNAVRIYDFPKSGHAHRVSVFAKLAGIAHETIFVVSPPVSTKHQNF